MSAKLCVVSKVNLPKTPQGFQKYAEYYFEKTTILGQECYYAFRICDGYYFGLFNTSMKGTRGVAPIILGKREDQFTIGIPDRLTLDEWIETESQKPADIRLVDQNYKLWSEDTIDTC